MKRSMAFLLALALLILAAAAAFTAFAEDEDEGDDSGQIPVDMMEDEETAEELTEELPESRILQTGDKGDDVRALQARLKELQYYSEEPTGRYDKKTEEAVKKYQEDYDLEATGVADLRTLSVLYSMNQRPLRYGSTGEDVRQLQIQLTDLGYYKGKISGNFLEATQKAVKELQEKNGLEVTGVADMTLQDLLAAGRLAGKNDTAAATPTPVPDLIGYLVDDTEGVPVSDEPVAYTKKLKNGSSGKLVKQMQIRLAELGYYDGPISGNFMKYTTRAVKAIQKQNGMEETGVVDEATWNIIFNDPHVVLPGATPKPTPSPTPVPFAITVDVANQITTVYGRDENGEYTVVVRQMLCSTGLRATPSTPGDWVLNGRHATWCVFPKWNNSYARYWTRINSEIAFHSPIYTAVSNQAMKISTYKKLGQRASHGCVRLTVWDAKWIYDNVGAGTVVSIVEGLPSDPETREALKLPPLDTKYCTPISTPEPTAEPAYSASEVPQLNGMILKQGKNNEAVYWMQRRLTELGYYHSRCTGHMLDATVRALKEFQKDHGYSRSGQADQKMLQALADAVIITTEVSADPEE